MKNIIIFLLSLFPFALLAQSIERQVICSSGGYHSSTFQASSTIGEFAISSYSPGTVIITQGFQQPDGLPDVAVIELESGISINAYPNPTSSAVVLDFQVEKPLQVSIQLFDVLGKTVEIEQNTIYINDRMTHVLDLTNFPAGSYFVRLSDDKGLLNNSIKIQKIE